MSEDGRETEVQKPGEVERPVEVAVPLGVRALLSMQDGDDFEFDPPKVRGIFLRPADFE